MLGFGYWTNFVRLNLAYPNVVATVVLFHLFASVTCQLSFNQAASFVEQVGSLYNAVNDCEFTCAEGYQRVTNPDYEPQPNGCGTYGVQVTLDQFPSITDCCNKHDICYDTCGSNKNLCDEKLNKCVKDICENNKDPSQEQTCQSAAKIIYGGTAFLGCPAFLDAQKKACLCRWKKQYSNKNKEL